MEWFLSEEISFQMQILASIDTWHFDGTFREYFLLVKFWLNCDKFEETSFIFKSKNLLLPNGIYIYMFVL